MPVPTESISYIGRQHFAAETLSAMDEIAALILAYQSLAAMGRTFHNAPGLDHGEASPRAAVVLKATKRTAAALQRSIFTKGRDRSVVIADVRREFLPVLREAARSAQWLAEQESAAVGGNEIEVRVLAPIRCLVIGWTNTHQGA